LGKEKDHGAPCPPMSDDRRSNCSHVHHVEGYYSTCITRRIRHWPPAHHVGVIKHILAGVDIHAENEGRGIFKKRARGVVGKGGQTRRDKRGTRNQRGSETQKCMGPTSTVVAYLEGGNGCFWRMDMTAGCVTPGVALNCIFRYFGGPFSLLPLADSTAPTVNSATSSCAAVPKLSPSPAEDLATFPKTTLRVRVYSLPKVRNWVNPGAPPRRNHPQ
jgi:hypothetical protein